MYIELKIPVCVFKSFRIKVLDTNFKGRRPLLSSHPFPPGKYEFCAFFSDERDDLDRVLSMIPEGSSYQLCSLSN